MELVGFLIVFPLVIAVILSFVRSDTARTYLVIIPAVIIAAASIALYVIYGSQGSTYFTFSSTIVDIVCIIVSIAIGAIILVYGFRYKRILPIVLGAVQLIGSLIFDFAFGHGIDVSRSLYVDGLSLLMVLIIGIVGSGICVYALGYMQDFQAHEPNDAPDRRPIFFALMFLFLSAMYIIVLSDNMTWMFAGWEITTLCSFLLIGYTKTEEAIDNAFRQINMNLLGGIAFLVALYVCAIGFETLSFKDFLEIGSSRPNLVIMPVIALSIAGITKAAQMPFHTWLLGAMVAPTPTSALLHSSTMVKAGVFLLVKLAPIFVVCPIASTLVVLVGGLTFMLCSFMAISQTNAKRVLAYSTIANLGLITACAGVGTPEAVWAAMLLILFHAIAKSLLFLCVGTAEHHIGSRDIEDMDQLFQRMPKLSRFMMLGIMCMFIAPFGMLIAKWGALVALIDMHQAVLLILLAFGSAATFMFWAKWLGKLAGIAGTQENIEGSVFVSEWVSIGLMAVLIALCCLCLPLISIYMVDPYIVSSYAYAGISDGMVSSAFDGTIDVDDLWLASIACVFAFIVMFAGLGRTKSRQVGVYLAGISADNANRVFRDSLSGETIATARNWYMTEAFNEDRLSWLGTVVCIILEAAFFIVGCVTLGIF
ncbi:MAG: proton-conducting transporter membrane subunit [Eggerthellaceae bacterium]|nr:proton-conducting transporter membrane subunit [Eggerthellaceae bacterium]